MNLANCIEYDIETRCYRIVSQDRSASKLPWFSPIATPQLFAPPPERQVAPDGTFRRAMRCGGNEILAVLRAAGRILSESGIAQRLPHVHGTTLRVRLCRMTAREDIVRYGERSSCRYGLPGGSTSGSS